MPTEWIDHLPISIIGDEITINHDMGFFSCCSVRLDAVIAYYNKYKRCPTRVDSSKQFTQYNTHGIKDIDAAFFQTKNDYIEISEVNFKNLYQFMKFADLDFFTISPFINKYFYPSAYVVNFIKLQEAKLNIFYDNLCGIMYRGMDKSAEVGVSDYNTFIEKCKQIHDASRCQFFIMTDDLDFRNTFRTFYPDTLYISEIPLNHYTAKTCAHFDLMKEDRTLFAVMVLAAVIILSKCKHLVVSTGNCGLWPVLYRGNAHNVHQYLTKSTYKDVVNHLYGEASTMEHNKWV